MWDVQVCSVWLVGCEGGWCGGEDGGFKLQGMLSNYLAYARQDLHKNVILG